MTVFAVTVISFTPVYIQRTETHIFASCIEMDKTTIPQLITIMMLCQESVLKFLKDQSTRTSFHTETIVSRRMTQPDPKHNMTAK